MGAGRAARRCKAVHAMPKVLCPFQLGTGGHNASESDLQCPGVQARDIKPPGTARDGERCPIDPDILNKSIAGKIGLSRSVGFFLYPIK